MAFPGLFILGGLALFGGARAVAHQQEVDRQRKQLREQLRAQQAQADRDARLNAARLKDYYGRNLQVSSSIFDNIEGDLNYGLQVNQANYRNALSSRSPNFGAFDFFGDFGSGIFKGAENYFNLRKTFGDR